MTIPAIAVIAVKLDHARISTSEAAAWLGVSPRTIRRWVAMRAFPVLDVGGGRVPRYRFRASDLASWLEGVRVERRRSALASALRQ